MRMTAGVWAHRPRGGGVFPGDRAITLTPPGAVRRRCQLRRPQIRAPCPQELSTDVEGVDDGVDRRVPGGVMRAQTRVLSSWIDGAERGVEKLPPQPWRSHRPRSEPDSGSGRAVVPSAVPRRSTRHAAESTRCPQGLWETRLPSLHGARSVAWYPQREGGYWPQVTTDRRASARTVAPGTVAPSACRRVRRHGR